MLALRRLNPNAFPKAASSISRPAAAAALKSHAVVSSSSKRAFHATPRPRIQVGDTIPDVELMEGSPGNKVRLSRELGKGKKGVIVGVPAAYSPACSASHVPGYVNAANLKTAGQVFVVSVNDAFVMKSWGATLDPAGKLRYLADPAGELTEALEMGFEGSVPIFGNRRSKRYAIVVEDGRVSGVHVEPDNTGVDVSAAEKVLG